MGSHLWVTGYQSDDTLDPESEMSKVIETKVTNLLSYTSQMFLSNSVNFLIETPLFYYLKRSFPIIAFIAISIVFV